MSKESIFLFIACCVMQSSCDIDKEIPYGNVSTKIVDDIQTTSAIAGGRINLDYDGRYMSILIKESGFLYSENKNYLNLYPFTEYFTSVLDDVFHYKAPEADKNDFSYRIQNLQPNTHYYIQAYAIIHSNYNIGKEVKYENCLYGSIEEFITKEIEKEEEEEEPIQLDAPIEVIAEWLFSSGVRVSWKDVTNAIAYEIYRASSIEKEDTFVLIGTQTVNYFEDNEPMAGDNYYKIRAINGAYKSEYSDIAYFDFNLTNLSPCPPDIFSVTGNQLALIISWAYSTDMLCGTPTSYVIKKSDPYTGEIELLTMTTETRYIDTSIHPGINRYWVIARNNHSESASIFNISDIIPLKAPTELRINKTADNTIYLSWNGVSDATGYQLYVSSSINGTYTKIRDVINNIDHTELAYYPDNQMRYFKVMAIWNPPYSLPMGGIRSEFSNSASFVFE